MMYYSLLQVSQDTDAVLGIAKAISDYGVLIVIAAFMLFFMFLLFRHFLKLFEEMFNKMSSTMTTASTSEAPMEQIRVLQSVVFDLSKYIYLEHLQRIFTENHLENKDLVQQKVKDVCYNMHNDRKSKFDNFRYHGYPLSDFCDSDWPKKMESVGLKYLYLHKERFDIKETFAAIDLAYNQIKIEFYNNIISKS